MISYTEQKDQWYNHFNTLPLKERFDMFMDLLEQDVSDKELIEDDFGTIPVDLKSELNLGVPLKACELDIAIVRYSVFHRAHFYCTPLTPSLDGT